MEYWDPSDKVRLFGYLLLILHKLKRILAITGDSRRAQINVLYFFLIGIQIKALELYHAFGIE